MISRSDASTIQLPEMPFATSRVFLIVIVVVLLLIGPCGAFGLLCSRYPANTLSPKSPVDENFAILLSGNPRTYILGQAYNISLHAYNGHRFVSAVLVLENDRGDKGFHEDLGRLEVIDPVETRYRPNCVNMVESTNTNPKTRLDVQWVAPAEAGSGCILIRATVLQHRDVWFMDDGALTRRICEEVVDDVESRSAAWPHTPCCACDEARYEITFEGIWSRNLHPKYFPARGWTTRFSDIVGAAHAPDYRFWDVGVLASAGMREFAEHGSTRLLEREFTTNFKEGKIRTIIKARGPSFPNLNGVSVASMRVDPKHHQLSLAAKIEPSPDWIVGVAGLELCLFNCTWLEEKVVNLYPWDVGTDAGPTYTSADQPQVPPDVIRRMRSDYPNDPRSPFFDESGAPMKPLASLTVRKQRLYQRRCEDEDSNNEGVPRECLTHPWSPWSRCSASCGEGRQFRVRVYKQPEAARFYNCDELVVNRQERSCVGDTCDDSISNSLDFTGRQLDSWRTDIDEFQQQPDESGSDAECQVSAWGPWSTCNQTCGEGRMTRRRHYVNPTAERKCQRIRFVQLVDYKKCFGHQCLGEVSADGQPYGSNAIYGGGTFDEERGYGQRRNGNQDEVGVLDNSRSTYFESPFEAEGDAYEGLPYDGYKFEPVRQEPLLTNSSEGQGGGLPPVGYKAEDLRIEGVEGPGQHSGRAEAYHISPDSPRRQPIVPEHKAPSRSRSRAEDSSEIKVPVYCFHPLRLVNCPDSRVVGNFWFYNYCSDECMLYAADSCDHNRNKFTSLEMCEQQCRHRAMRLFLLHKQSQDCHQGRQRHRGRTSVHNIS